jgi:pyruvate kinase
MSEFTCDLAVADLRATLEDIREGMIAHARASEAQLERMSPEAHVSALNLLHADALRSGATRETRPLLRAQGVTTFDDAGPHALRSVESALRLLGSDVEFSMEAPNVREALQITHERADALLGPPGHQRTTRIMVTLPTQAADDPAIVRTLLERGTDLVRINCAHDGAEVWSRMLAHLESARRETGRPCKVFMDLAGPKVRTGALPDAPGVIKFFPRRDSLGRVRRPARILLTDPASARSAFGPVDAVVPVAGAWAMSLREGQLVRTIDARGKQRTMRVIERAGDGAIVSCDAAGFLVEGTRLERLGDDGQPVDGTHVDTLSPGQEHILLRPGYLLRLTRDASRGELARFDEHGVMRTPPAIGCTLTQAFDHLRVGERVLFDDGKAGGRVVRLTEEGALIEIETARNNGVKLRADKGINFPDTHLDVPPLTEKDLADLAFVAAHADAVGLSFVRGPEGVRQLQRELKAHGAATPGPAWS